MTIDQYNELFVKQEGKCIICGKHQNELKGRLYVDHDHSTGKIRGLLCKKCNLLLGYSNDDINILKGAIEYLNLINKENGIVE